jgi:hypothetical protein
MGSRLALLIAAALIFAPGQPGEGQPQQSRGGNLAARVLAPTVDEGMIRGDADVKHGINRRQANLWRPSITLDVVAFFALSALALLLVWIVASSTRPLLGRYRRRFRFSRAPPRFQPM